MDPRPEPQVPIRIEELLQHVEWLRGLARSLVRDPGTAADLEQETWLAALRRPPRGGASPRPWLERVVRNLARNRHRDERTRRVHEGHAPPCAGAPTPAEIAREVEAQRLLAEAVAALGEPERTLVVLRHFRGLDSAAIGRELGLPAGTVRWRLQRALEALRIDLDRRFGGERRAWSALLAPYAALPAGGGALVGIALVAAALLVVAAGWWSVRELGRNDERALRAGALAARTEPAALGDLPSGAESAAAEAPSKRSAVLTGPAEVPVPEPLPDIEGRVLVDGAEPGRPVALEVHFVEQRDHPTTGTRARVRSDVRKLLTDARGRFDAFALGPECTFRVKTPEFLVEAPETRWETPARGLVVELRTPPRLRGRVVTGDGEPVHGTAGVTWLQAEVEDWQMFSGPLDVDCDAEGRFEVSLLGLMSEGTPETCSAELLLEIPRVGRGHVESGSFPLADHDLGTLVLEPVRVLRFRVRDGRGQPLAGAVARLDDVWISKPSSPTNGEGFGELRHAPDRPVGMRFSAFGCVDQVLVVAPGDQPDVWLAAGTVLEIQLDRPAHLDGPFPQLVVMAREEPLESEPLKAPVPFLVDVGWIQGELGATPVYSRGSRKDAGGRTYTIHYQPDAGGQARIVGLRPDVLLTVEARDAAAQTVLAQDELVLAPGEHRRLELRYGDESGD